MAVSPFTSRVRFAVARGVRPRRVERNRRSASLRENSPVVCRGFSQKAARRLGNPKTSFPRSETVAPAVVGGQTQHLLPRVHQIPVRSVTASATDDAKDPKATWKDEHLPASVLFDTLDEKLRLRRKTETTTEDVSAMETVLGMHMSETAARIIATDFVSLGIDTPGKIKRAIVTRSLRLLLVQLLAVLANAAAAYAMFLLFQNAQVVTSNVFETPGAYFTTSVLENSTKVISGIVGASFAIESVAHLAIFVTFLANTIFFAFADLTKFGNAVSHLSLLSQTGGDVSSSSPISVISVPVFSTAKRAVDVIAASKRLSTLKLAVDDALTKRQSSLSNSDLLAGAFVLSVAEAELGFVPSEFGMDEKDAIAIGAVFADQDRNFDGLVDQTQLVAMVKHLLDSTSAELLFDLDWNPDDSYDAAFLFNSLDTNGDGKVSFQEVVAWWRANILDAEKKTKTNKEFDPNETFHESLLVGTRGPFAALAGRKAELAKEAPAAGRTSGAYFTTSVLENSTKVISGIVGASFAIESVAHLAGRTSEMTTVRSDDAVAETGTNATAVSLDPVNNSLDPVVDVSLDDAAADDAPNDARTIATQSAFSAGD